METVFGQSLTSPPPLWCAGFSPLAVKETVHHMMLVGCSAGVHLPPGRDNLWNCGGSLGTSTVTTKSLLYNHRPRYAVTIAMHNTLTTLATQ